MRACIRNTNRSGLCSAGQEGKGDEEIEKAAPGYKMQDERPNQWEERRGKQARLKQINCGSYSTPISFQYVDINTLVSQ